MTSEKQSMTNPKNPALGTKIHYLTKIAGKIGKQYGRDWGLDQHLTPYTRMNSEWVNDLIIKKEIISKLGKHRIVFLSDLWERADFKTKQVREITKIKINNFDYIKLKKFLYKQNQCNQN